VPEGSEETAPVRGRLRRRPRYARFIVTGGLVGLVAGLVVGLARAGLVDQPGVLVFYLAVLLSGLGVLFGAALAVLVEPRRPPRRASAPDDAT
jgi:hypothetical protein